MENINKKLENILSGVDKTKLNQAKKTAEQFMKTNEGKKLIEQLNNTDKNKLLNSFMKMDTNEIKSKLKNANISNLSNTDISSVINKLK